MSSAPTAQPPAHNGASSLRRLRELLHADPANHALWRRCAAAAGDARDYAALQEIAAVRLALHEDDHEAAFHQATALIGLKRPGEAIPLLETLLAGAPDEPAVLANLGLCHYALGQFADAAACLQRNYAAGRRDADLLRLLVSSYHYLGRIAEALEVATPNLDAARPDAALAGVFALAFLDGGDSVRAARCANWALKANPSSIDALVVQGTLDLGRLDLAAAVARFEGVTEQAPDNGRAWIGLGTAALLRRDIATAKTALGRGVTHMPGHVGSWHLLAWTELVNGGIDEAERLFEHALDLDRNFAESHGSLAAVAALRGNRERATREIDIAKRLDPSCVSAQYAASVLARNSGNPRAADDLIATAAASLAEQNGGPLSALLARLVRR
jgi:tetratricopeptide (TPR) repeat protein